jgi:hypothetical protein
MRVLYRSDGVRARVCACVHVRACVCVVLLGVTGAWGEGGLHLRLRQRSDSEDLRLAGPRRAHGMTYTRRCRTVPRTARSPATQHATRKMQRRRADPHTVACNNPHAAASSAERASRQNGSGPPIGTHHAASSPCRRAEYRTCSSTHQDVGSLAIGEWRAHARVMDGLGRSVVQLWSAQHVMLLCVMLLPCVSRRSPRP